MDDAIERITLPDGTTAVFIRSMNYADVVIILLLTAILFLLVVHIWRQR